MDLRGLALIGCRLLALYFAIEALLDLPLALATLPAQFQSFSLATALSAQIPALLHLLAAVGLWIAAPPLAVQFVASVPSSWSGRRRGSEELQRALFAVAGLLFLATLVDDLWQGYLSLQARREAPVAVLAALAVIAAAKIGVAAWLFRGAPRFPLAPPPAPAPSPGMAQLIGDLVASTGSLGARKAVELATTLRKEAETAARHVVRTSLDRVIAAVELRRPDLSSTTAADGTVTIVFSDMEGFTAMTQRLGDREAHKVIKSHNQIVRSALRQHRGQEVELQGDGFLLAFADAAQALRCAAAIQRDCGAYSARHPRHPIRVRIGAHTGTPIQEGDRFFGITVILAARIAAQAQGGETLVSAAVRDPLVGDDSFVFDGGRDAVLKGLDGTHRMYALLKAGA
ncbi:MAG: adenylate/guanylate cyclase domain-containing protein [Nevskiaceae bacterium]|nr:MAG: adenylate/guanylate cyclase domain-containing protein [Nevskiaceae bacterium]